uniref:Uncharacterized protein n=1 Tax=Magallana gigas TaxID=29159 RepID=K1QA99_MAGGI
MRAYSLFLRTDWRISLETAGKENKEGNLKCLLHFAIIQANKFGQPNGQNLETIEDQESEPQESPKKRAKTSSPEKILQLEKSHNKDDMEVENVKEKNQAVMKKVEKKSDSKPKNFTKGTDLLYVVHFEQFNQEIGQTFPANFDEQRVTPKDYFDLMLSPGTIWDFIRNTVIHDGKWDKEEKTVCAAFQDDVYQLLNAVASSLLLRVIDEGLSTAKMKKILKDCPSPPPETTLFALQRIRGKVSALEEADNSRDNKEAIAKLTFSTESGQDPGTLYFYRNLLNHRGVKGEFLIWSEFSLKQ